MIEGFFTTAHGLLPAAYSLAAVTGQTTKAGAKLDNFLQFVTTPTGIAACVLFFALVALMLAWRRGRWIALTLLLWIASFGVATREGVVMNPLAFPLSILQNHSQALTAALLALLSLPALIESRHWRRQLVLGGTIFFFILEMVFSGRALGAGSTARGLAGGGIFVLIFVVLGVGIAKQLQTMEDVVRLVRCVVAAALLIILGTIYQLAVNRGAITAGNRLYATTQNPQYAALTFAIALLPAAWLLLRKEEPMKLRALWGFTVGFLVLFLVWTGSRTGALMSLVGIGLMFRARIGRLLGVGIVAAIVVLAGLQFFSPSASSANRLLNTDNTRKQNWSKLVDNFLAHPLTGSVSGDITSSMAENSYLSVASALGLVGLVPLGLSMFLVGRSLLRLWRRRALLGHEAFVVDLMVGGIGSIAAGAMFEALLLGTLTSLVFSVYVYLAILAFLQDWLNTAALEENGPPDRWAAHGDWQARDLALQP